MKIRKSLAALPIAFLALTGCSMATAEPDQVGLTYNAGPLSSTSFDACFAEGEKTVDGPFDKHFAYPAGQRTYEFTGGEKSESGPITAPSEDNIQMAVSGFISFELNTDCAVLQEFHESIGLKYGAGSDGLAEWTEALNLYLGQPLQRAINVAVAEYGWQEQAYDATGEVRDALQKRVAEVLPDYVAGAADSGDFFQGFSVTLQKPVPPQQLADQLRDQQVEREKVNTINSQQAALDAELAQNQALIDRLGVDGYLAYRNLENCEDRDDATICIPMFPGSSVAQILPTP